ncbi:hypothetical protein KGO95_02420 [Patescibacteria group bacterium]|nr:hypothetical protein [Patescibacteria group bacterium]
MKPSVKRALSLLLSAALLVGALMVYGLLIQGEYAAVQQLRGTLAAKTQILNVETKAVEQVKNLVVSLQSIGNISNALSAALPSDSSLSAVMAQLNALAQAHGVVLQGVGVNYLPIIPPPVKLTFAKGIGSMRLDIKFVGPYAAGRDFLIDLERNLRIMDVRTLQMSSAVQNQSGQGNQTATQGTQDLLNFGLTVDTYYQAN